MPAPGRRRRPRARGRARESSTSPVPTCPTDWCAGTCVEFDPTGTDRQRTIFVDPGHGGPDPGAVGNGLSEEKLTLAVALRLSETSSGRDGFHVVLSRIADTSVAKLADAQVVNGAITNSGAHIDTTSPASPAPTRPPPTSSR